MCASAESATAAVGSTFVSGGFATEADGLAIPRLVAARRFVSFVSWRWDGLCARGPRSPEPPEPPRLRLASVNNQFIDNYSGVRTRRRPVITFLQYRINYARNRIPLRERQEDLTNGRARTINAELVHSGPLGCSEIM